jgi:cytidine deaminase
MSMNTPSKDMIELARAMMQRAHAPYSRFHVGAVIRGANGKLYGGCNVENAAYPQGLCAEATAVGVMVADGETKISEVLVMAQNAQLVMPCGGCRQRLREFAGDATQIFICGPEGLRCTVTLGELLPLSFGPDHLNISKV